MVAPSPRRLWSVSLAAALLASSAVLARIFPSPQLPWRAAERLHERDDHQLEAQIDAFTRAGSFPTSGRTLEEKVREARAFLDRELARPEQRGVGASVAIVYEDQVVLSQGYGLRKGDDPSAAVDSSTLFQIGSVSKTFISLGLAILVEEGKIKWTDTVKQHMPSFALFDKYAEKFATIGDLCAMNSGLGELPDIALVFGLYSTDEALVNALVFMEPEHSLRGGHEYSNSNFAILGQLIESVTSQPWNEFLQQRIWGPLGMTRTFASASDVPADRDVSFGHFLCGGKLLGPYSLVEDEEAQLIANGRGGKIAAGSVLSSSDDLATLLRVILNKGKVDGVSLFNSTRTISEMVTGKYAVNQEFRDEFSIEGHQFNPDGDTLASGYGFDYVGHAQWGHAYFDKSGDTTVHVTRTGFAPDANLGVAIVSNTQTPGGHLSYPLDHIRSYLMGIFLDVPSEILEFSYGKWRRDDKLVPVLDGIPACGLQFWENPSYIKLTSDEAAALEGRYVAQSSSGFFSSLKVRRQGDSGLVFEYGVLSASLELFKVNEDRSRVFVWAYAHSPLLIIITENEFGKFDVEAGVVFRQL